ncbi:hypothetical protein ATANTOWER_020567 [Ataeniobius toweri]|uniref:DNA methyltransferase 1-associated 1 domain-containing protein n=1 Tax=Ataeniobius toweri TaxID=208326 RepID=A0ABU7C2Q1_9TELE|nr:hypothetical protein [Ataeniobius toweri]
MLKVTEFRKHPLAAVSSQMEILFQSKFFKLNFHSFLCPISLVLDLNPMPTEEIVQMFNELRSDLVLLYELKQAHSNCEYEQQMLRHRYEALLKAGSGAGSGGTTGGGIAGVPQGGDLIAVNSTASSTPGAEAQPWPSVDDIKVEAKEQIIDVVGAPLTPNSRKRRESASSSSSVKKAKKP